MNDRLHTPDVGPFMEATFGFVSLVSVETTKVNETLHCLRALSSRAGGKVGHSALRSHDGEVDTAVLGLVEVF